MLVLHRYRMALVVLVQLGIVAASYVASFTLRLSFEGSEVPWSLVLKTLPLLIVIRMGTLGVFRLYRGLWSYVSVVDLIQIIKATTVGSLIFALLLVLIFGLEGFPRSLFFLDWMGNIFLLSGIRLFVRLMREQFWPVTGRERSFPRLLIIGAGDAGAELCKQALSNRMFRFNPVAFVDDDHTKVGSSILGVPVAGECKDIRRVANEYRVETAIIAIPSATPSQRRAMVEACQQAEVPFKILPAMPEILEGTVSISRIREVDPADLLGRPPARLDRAAIESFIRGRVILVTGAAGSVGSELARQIAGIGPGLLLLIDRAENSLMFLESELQSTFPDIPLVVKVIGVTDEVEMGRLMSEHRPHVVFHTAAHKHVPLMERTPGEAVKNNVGGTYVVARGAQNNDVATFVLVSTDKAVNPTNVMGATKRLTELIALELNEQGSTRFVSVRFGNVLGSSASVVPIFKQQIASGGPVTVTHPDAERYFMSVAEAAGLILQAGSVGKGGETFVLDMGEPVKIVTLAETMITLSGLKPYEEIGIMFTGLRPGEKLTEELKLDSQEFQPTAHEKILMLKNEHPTLGVLTRVDEFFRVLPHLGPEEVKNWLGQMVPEYQPNRALPSTVRNRETGAG